MIDLLGTVGAGLLVWCGVPLLVATLRDGHARGVSGPFLGAWLAGEICMGSYVAVTAPDRWLLANYAGNILIVSIVLGVKIRGGRA